MQKRSLNFQPFQNKAVIAPRQQAGPRINVSLLV